MVNILNFKQINRSLVQQDMRMIKIIIIITINLKKKKKKLKSPVASHKNLELGRKDDLESLGYLFVYFLKS